MDNSFISLFSIPLALKSNMNFHNFQTQPVKGKSQVLNPLYSSRQGAKEYVR